MNPAARWSFLLCGHLCVALGAVGAVLPVMPTTPFLLLAAACYVRSSDRAYERLLNSRFFGPIIRDYRRGRGVRARTKAIALLALWISLGVSMWRTDKPAVDRFLIAVGAVSSVFILRLRTLRSEAGGEAAG